MRYLVILPLVFAVLTGVRSAAAQPPAQAIVVVISDSHSAYDRMAQFLWDIEELKAENRGTSLSILINGDAFEWGNVLAQRSGAEVDLAFLKALARRAPTVLNLGNHEMDFFDAAEVVSKLEATGVRVISGNARDRATGRLLAAPYTTIAMGGYEARVIGFVTDRLSTFRKAVQPELDLGDPVIWAKQNLPNMLRGEPVAIVLSHAGLQADRQILPLVGPTVLFAGAHDHQRFNDQRYFQSGSWLECYTVARLVATKQGPRWDVRQYDVGKSRAGDPEMIALVKRVRKRYLTAEDNAVVATLRMPLSTTEAAQFASSALAAAAGVDAAFIGNTTFGAGFSSRVVTQLDFDAFLRFDGPIYTATVTGERLAKLLRAADQSAITPFVQRTGEFNYTAIWTKPLEGRRSYRIATTDWGAKNSDRYFGLPAIAWQEISNLKLKAAVRAGMAQFK